MYPCLALKETSYYNATHLQHLGVKHGFGPCIPKVQPASFVRLHLIRLSSGGKQNVKSIQKVVGYLLEILQCHAGLPWLSSVVGCCCCCALLDLSSLVGCLLHQFTSRRCHWSGSRWWWSLRHCSTYRRRRLPTVELLWWRRERCNSPSDFTLIRASRYDTFWVTETIMALMTS